MNKYIDRQQAGTLLAIQLESYKNNPNVVALAVPRVVASFLTIK